MTAKEMQSIVEGVRWRASELMQLIEQWHRKEITDQEFLLTVDELSWKLHDNVRIRE